MNRLIAMVIVAGLALAACSSTDEDEEVIQALAASIAEDEGFEDYSVSETDAECTARAVVDELGRDRVVEIGFSEDEDAELDFDQLTDDEIIVLGSAMEDCISDIDQAVVDAIAAGILEEQDPNFPVTESEAECVARGVEEAISLPRLIILGARSSDADPFADLDPAEAEQFSTAFLDCIDIRQLILDSIAAEGVPAEVVACFDQNVADDDIAAIFRAGFTGEDVDAASAELFTAALEGCI